MNTYKSKLKKFIVAILVVTNIVANPGIYTGISNNLIANAASSRQVEALDRGLVAIKTSNGVFLSWRYLGTDSSSIGFNVFRNGTKINSSLITNSTNYLDTAGTASSSYYITASVNNAVIETSDTVSTNSQNYFDIPLSVPSGGKTPSGESYTYTPNDASVGDLDGDGEYEIILKWDPSNSKDNSLSGYTGNVILDAYKLDGTRLWRIDLGKNIRAGAHYTQFMVYDFDGDGYSEMICKTADGTLDGTGKYIGSSSADYRNSAGRILSGPEYLTLFDGKTGAALDTIDYEPGRGTVSSWGDSYGNRVDRFLAAVAYLNGQTPSVVMCRGYYTRAVLVAYNVVNKKLVKQWKFDSNDSGNSAYKGQGNHSLAVADADGDGYDEIVYGSCTIDHNGKGLYSTGLGHGDALHVGDFLPNRTGIEVWSCHEEKYGASLRDAKTGAVIFRQTASTDTGRAVAGNFIPGNSSAEFVSYASSNVYDGNGTVIAQWRDISTLGDNFIVHWDGDLEDEVLDKTMVDDYSNGRILTGSNVTSCNTTKATPSLCADILGDWRDEIVWPTTDGKSLRVYMTTDVTSNRVFTLMHDTQYRCQIASQNVAYNQPAHTSFFLGTGFSLPSQPNVYAKGLTPKVTPTPTVTPTIVPAAITESSYMLKNPNSGMYLEVANGTAASGTNVQQWGATGSASHNTWYIKYAGSGYYYLYSKLGDGNTYLLDVTNGIGQDGINIQIEKSDLTSSQLFKFSKNSDGTYTIYTKASKDMCCVSVANSSTSSGANIEQSTYSGLAGQKWILEKQITTTPTPTTAPTTKPTVTPTVTPTATPTTKPTATPTITPTPAIDGPVPAVTVNTTNNGNSISQTFTVKAVGGTIDLSKVSIVYTADGMSTAAQNVYIDNAALQLNVAPYYSSINSAVKGSITNGSLALSISSSTGLVTGTGSLSIELRFAKADWSAYGTLTNPVVKVYYEGVLVQ